jgi:hypothetical protein
VLKQLADLLQKEAREIDHVGRYGGEEFMLILPGTVLDAGVTFAERVRLAIAEHTFTFEGGAIHRTASFGVAAWPHPRIDGCDALVKAADDALYVAKETGRNKVIRFDGPDFNAHSKPDDAEQPDVDVTDRVLGAERAGDVHAGERHASQPGSNGGGAADGDQRAASADHGAPAGA